MEKFICPHQFNYIRVQLNQLLQTVYFAADYRVYAAHKLGVRDNVLSMFQRSGPSEIRLFEGMEDVKGQSDIGEFMERLEPYVVPFPVLEPDNLRKLFPKVKKLPDLAAVNWSKLSYFGWRDIATNTLFVVTRHNGKLIGIRNRITSLIRPEFAVCTIIAGRTLLLPFSDARLTCKSKVRTTRNRSINRLPISLFSCSWSVEGLSVIC